MNQNAELETEVRELRRAAQKQTAFLAQLAHELRTPLTSILGFAEILLTQEELTGSQRNFCERIQNSARQIQNDLDRLSELSRTKSPLAEPKSEIVSSDGSSPNQTRPADR